LSGKTVADQVICALSDVFARWFAYQQQRGILVCCSDDEMRPSPCRYDPHNSALWKYSARPQAADLHNIAAALACNFHPAIHAYYGYGFAGQISASFKGLAVTLVQPWNDEDFERLQENMVAHVMMLQRLKLPITLFLATVPNELQVISLDNETGAVVLEQLGQPKRWVLADSLPAFLQRLSPLPLRTTSPVAQVNLLA
jgi:SecY interacting protein Syd